MEYTCKTTKEKFTILNGEDIVLETPLNGNSLDYGRYACLLNALILAKRGDIVYTDSNMVLEQVTFGSPCYDVILKPFCDDCKTLWRAKGVAIKRK